VRVVLDTSVLVSAFAARGLCAEVFELVLLDHDLIVGRDMPGELEIENIQPIRAILVQPD
jgi:uncharacterized protein